MHEVTSPFLQQVNSRSCCIAVFSFVRLLKKTTHEMNIIATKIVRSKGYLYLLQFRITVWGKTIQVEINLLIVRTQ